MPSSKSGPGSRSAAPPKSPSKQEGERKVYFEFVQAGPSMRVTAIDEHTGLEATIVGPANAGRMTLERAALAKLCYVLSVQSKSK